LVHARVRDYQKPLEGARIASRMRLRPMEVSVDAPHLCFRALRHLCEPLCVIEPAVERADDILFGGDPVREERLKECVAVDGGASASPASVRVAGGSARPPTSGGRGRRG